MAVLINKRVECSPLKEKSLKIWTHPNLEIQKELQKTAKQMTIIMIFSPNPVSPAPTCFNSPSSLGYLDRLHYHIIINYYIIIINTCMHNIQYIIIYWFFSGLSYIFFYLIAPYDLSGQKLNSTFSIQLCGVGFFLGYLRMLSVFKPHSTGW
jgi:hypothetical protein